ncbi:uncharacterized protein EHS24_004570 [Apiotrichum porosum]|uniref:Uncharacterized protein n=1 Tax=Apiotrichum porosum TaxID=105984 RepID=A0A427Y5H1_9TREE|nr:uncharacterized protein EHS24_004570 [Apiotrichum porosum]RSH86326.1 hypothetical protein EHS24_004570 [Apiotrichum porosum]
MLSQPFLPRVVSLISLSLSDLRQAPRGHSTPNMDTTSVDLVQLSDLLGHINLEKAHVDLVMPKPPSTEPSVTSIRVTALSSGVPDTDEGDLSLNTLLPSQAIEFEQRGMGGGIVDDSDSDDEEVEQVFVPPTEEELKAFVSRIDAWRTQVGRTGPTQLRRNHACLHLARLMRQQADGLSSTSQGSDKGRYPPTESHPSPRLLPTQP